MKLKSLSLLATLVFTSSFTNAQKLPKDTLRYEIIYDYSYQVNKEDTLSKRKEQMVLKIAKDFSFYTSLNNMKIMDLKKNWKESDGLPDVKALPKTRLNYTIVKLFNSNMMINSDWIRGDTYVYNQDLDKFKWKLQEGQKEILGYKCRKASTQFAGREYVAWYTTEISISDGPYKFHGLPGLILSIADTDNQYQFNITSFKNSIEYFNTADIAERPVFLTKEEYKTMKKRYLEKPSSVVNTGGLSFPKEYNDLADQRAKDKMKYENNPMELND